MLAPVASLLPYPSYLNRILRASTTRQEQLLDDAVHTIVERENELKSKRAELVRKDNDALTFSQLALTFTLNSHSSHPTQLEEHESRLAEANEIKVLRSRVAEVELEREEYKARCSVLAERLSNTETALGVAERQNRELRTKYMAVQQQLEVLSK